MRVAIIFCLFAAVTAQGYNYNRLSSQGQTGGHISRGSLNLAGPISLTHLVQQGRQAQQVNSAPDEQQEVNKEFYTYTAPEEEFENPQSTQQLSSTARRNVRVIFIHAPQQSGLNKAVQNLAQQRIEEQTAIYVLTRQPDLSHLANSLQRETTQVSHKPQVHFIKYRTQEDAARAQESIRAQYDSLGGSVVNADGNIASVLNFASPASSQGQLEHGSVGSSAVGNFAASSGILQANTPSSNYLPIRL